jgi:alpha-glucosidase
MPWSAQAPGFGFTSGAPWLPFGADAAARAVQVQSEDPASTLSSYRRLLAVRSELLRAGELGDEVELLDVAPDVLAFRRGPLTVVLNTAAEPVQVPVAGGGALIAATVDGAELVDGVVVVPAAATVWLR